MENFQTVLVYGVGAVQANLLFFAEDWWDGAKSKSQAKMALSLRLRSGLCLSWYPL